MADWLAGICCWVADWLTGCCRLSCSWLVDCGKLPADPAAMQNQCCHGNHEGTTDKICKMFTKLKLFLHQWKIRIDQNLKLCYNNWSIPVYWPDNVAAACGLTRFAVALWVPEAGPIVKDNWIGLRFPAALVLAVEICSACKKNNNSEVVIDPNDLSRLGFEHKNGFKAGQKFRRAQHCPTWNS